MPKTQDSRHTNVAEPFRTILDGICPPPRDVHDRPLPFPDRKIVTIPDDRMAHADGAIREAALDFHAEIARAFNAQDSAQLVKVSETIRWYGLGLLEVAGMALSKADEVCR